MVVARVLVYVVCYVGFGCFGVLSFVLCMCDCCFVVGIVVVRLLYA